MKLIDRIRADATRLSITPDIIPMTSKGETVVSYFVTSLITSVNIYKRKDPDGWIADFIIDPRLADGLELTAIGIPDHAPLPTRRQAYERAVMMYSALLQLEVNRQAEAA